MAKLSQTQKIVRYLKSNPDRRYTANEIAKAIIDLYPADYAKKRENARFESDSDFISQVVAEIGSQKDRIKSAEPKVQWQDKPRPRVYFYESQAVIDDIEIEPEIEEVDVPTSSNVLHSLSEHDLYPFLIEFLKSELKLHSMRIDEKRSKNSKGAGGNQWLHPDIVSMETVDKGWNDAVQNCVQQGGGQRVRLWSFEVKKALTGSNVRKSFFQAVSNSSWANEGYLVATSIADANTEHELRMLSALHGIGVIVLNTSNPSESEVWLPARTRPEVDWQSVNRIVEENTDFKAYIEQVSAYYKMGWLRSTDWNK